MVDTLDLVVVGHNKDGKYFVLACHDIDHGDYIAICLLDEREIPDIEIGGSWVDQPDNVMCQYMVDEWFIPTTVIEVSCQSIASSYSRSIPYFLSNPKFIKLRLDKYYYDTTSLDEVHNMWRLQ